MLFSADFYPTQEEAIAQLGQYFQSPEEDDVDESGILQVLHKVELKEADSEYLQARTANIMEKIPEIDEKLNQAAAGWKTKRMGKVELTILRLALYEMLHDDAIPEKVSINEAVELAKKFGGNDSPSFVNGSFFILSLTTPISEREAPAGITPAGKYEGRSIPISANIS